MITRYIIINWIFLLTISLNNNSYADNGSRKTLYNIKSNTSLPCSVGDSIKSPVLYINSYFENASPLFWEYNPDGSVQITFLYDHERDSPNRASNHWHFQVQSVKGAEVTLILNYFEEVWNGRMSAAYSRIKTFYMSPDGKTWSIILVEAIDEKTLKLKFRMVADKIYLTGVEPYRLSDFERFLDEIKGNPLIEISPVGKTVEGRPLEIIRVGDSNAPYRVFIRARAHPWEAGGNWVVQGLVHSLLEKSEENARYLKKYCVYILPMANKDGVSRGLTRFNSLGKDLNRNWDAPADPVLAPENFAMESWLNKMIAMGKKPHLAIDLHNDSGGRLHISRPDINLDQYLANMKRFESLLFKYTWFREGSTGSSFRNPGSFGEGLVERFGIDACVLELNRIWIEGLQKEPFGEDWELFGKQLRDVFYNYF